MSFTSGEADFHATSPMVCPFSPEGGVRLLPPTAPSSSAYPALSRLYYIPFQLRVATTIRRFWWANGATVGTDSIKMGIYAMDKTGTPTTILVTGNATLSAGANALQFDDITDVTLPAGKYALAFVCGGVTATFFRAAITSVNGTMIQASAGTTLPSPATPSIANTTVWWPVCGFTTRAAP